MKVLGIIYMDDHGNVVVVPTESKESTPFNKFQPETHPELGASIKMLELSVRAEKALVDDGITAVRDVVSMTEHALLQIPWFGRKSLQNLKEKLADRGLRLRE